jgi:hypothetical protein
VVSQLHETKKEENGSYRGKMFSLLGPNAMPKAGATVAMLIAFDRSASVLDIAIWARTIPTVPEIQA